MFAAAVGHRSGRATPSLRDAPQRQSMETTGRGPSIGTETLFRQTRPLHKIQSLLSLQARFRGGELYSRSEGEDLPRGRPSYEGHAHHGASSRCRQHCHRQTYRLPKWAIRCLGLEWLSTTCSPSRANSYPVQARSGIVFREKVAGSGIAIKGMFIRWRYSTVPINQLLFINSSRVQGP